MSSWVGRGVYIPLTAEMTITSVMRRGILSVGTAVRRDWGGKRWRTGKDRKVNKIIYPLVLWWQCNNQELQKRRQAQWKANPSCVPVSNKLLSLHHDECTPASFSNNISINQAVKNISCTEPALPLEALLYWHCLCLQTPSTEVGVCNKLQRRN